MRIVFVNVPNTYELIGNDPVIIKDQQGVYPPLGLLYMAAHMKNTGKYDIHVIDCQAEDIDHEQAALRCRDLKPDIIGLTTMTFTLVDCKLFIQEVRKHVPEAKVVVGGPHTSIFPDECLLRSGLGADYVVVGEGEITMDTLAQDIKNGTTKGQIYRQEAFISDLDKLPFAARELTEKHQRSNLPPRSLHLLS